MSKTTEHLLLIPGAIGWEIWTTQGDAPCSLHHASEAIRASDLTDLPTGELTMFFPARTLTAVTMRVNSEDDALFPDLAALHAERLGLRPDLMAGQLSDMFVISREPENTSLMSVFLRAPIDGDLPLRGPKAFDISARAFPVSGNTLAVWQEFGRWVFAIYQQGKPAYFQATAVDAADPDDSLVREIRLAMMQLSMQGLEIRPEKILVWTSQPSISSAALASAFRAEIEIAPRPAPVIPDPPSKLLPADVRAARRAAQHRLQITLGIAIVIIIYLGIIGWCGYGLWKTHAETKAYLADAEAAAPDGFAYTDHIAKWDELAPVIDLANSPVDILFRIASCIPANSGLRLKTADISGTEIKLIGEAQALPAVNTFSLKLNKASDLANFTWQTPEPNQSTRGWEFTYTAEVPTNESQP